MRRARELIVAGVAFAAGVAAGVLISDPPSDTTQSNSGEGVETNLAAETRAQAYYRQAPRRKR